MYALRYLTPFLVAAPLFAQDRPNVLLITCEDLSPHLGCYGDPDANTPNLDALRTESVMFTRAFAPAPVCAPTRSSIITGVSAVSLGTHPMRSNGRRPKSVPCFPQLLRRAGVFCTNDNKTDYNFKAPRGTWDRGKRWNKRKDGQPFFAVINLMTTHQGKVRLPEARFAKLTAGVKQEQRHDPAKVTLPPFHPDTPEVRRDWARYHDMASAMDAQVGGILRKLEADGLRKDTIVIFCSDHGTGMPRGKGRLYDFGTRVPLLVHVPERWRRKVGGKPGSTSGRLISLHDLAPTILWLFGVPVPKHMDGVRFLGDAPERKYVYCFRDRLGERTDMARSVRGARYLYIRNFHPDRERSPWHTYAEATPTMQVLRREFAAGRLNATQARLMQARKPREELYDVIADPHQLRNLIEEKEHARAAEHLRVTLKRWMFDVRDLGLLPEENMRLRFSRPEYDAVRDLEWNALAQAVWAAADLVGRGAERLPAMKAWTSHRDAAVRYWGLQAIGALGKEAVSAKSDVVKLLADPAPSVRLAAASALHAMGEGAVALDLVKKELAHEHHLVRLRAVDLADRMDEQARPLMDQLLAMKKDRNREVKLVLTKALADLQR